IHDAGWSAFLDTLTDKAERAAERAGHVVVRVPARFTTQNCHRCGAYVQKSLSVRTQICPSCGLVEDRDVNAAKNILQTGLQAGHRLRGQSGMLFWMKREAPPTRAGELSQSSSRWKRATTSERDPAHRCLALLIPHRTQASWIRE